MSNNRTILSVQDLENSRYMSLEAIAHSAEAIKLADALATGFVDEGKRRQPRAKQLAALSAVVCDLLRQADGDGLRYSHRLQSPASFTGLRIGHRPFVWVIRQLQRHKMIDVVPGYQRWGRFDADGPVTVGKSVASRFRAADWLLSLASQRGITPENWDRHYRVEAHPRSRSVIPLKLRTIGVLRTKRDMDIDLTDPATKAQYDRVCRLNDYVAGQAIGGAGNVAFTRMFSEGDAPDFAWNKGGRLYCVGGGYQLLKSHVRKSITINGAAVVELDISASHLTALSAMRGHTLSGDPYDVPGIPRAVVKAWVTMTFGYGSFHTRWPSKTTDQLTAKLDLKQPLGRAFPLGKVREAIIRHLPILADWPECGLSCHDLQFVESCAVISAMEVLAFRHNVLGLPVHDSLLVPFSKQQLAVGVMKDAYREAVGVEPVIKIS
jgi:hypothetical protein